jgi:hypothetical protein
MFVLPIPWYWAWAGILSYPSVANFELLVQNPNAKQKTAYFWLAFVGIPANLPTIALLVGVVLKLAGNPPAAVVPLIAVGLAALLLLSSFVTILNLIIPVAIQNFIAKRLGGRGTYKQLIYAEATFYVPLLLITSLLNLFPTVWVFAYPLELYEVILSIVAIKAVHQFGWRKAIISGLALATLLFLLAGGLGVGILPLIQHH